MKNALFASLATLSLFGLTALKAADENPNNTKDHVSSIAWIVERDKADDIGVDGRYAVLIGKVTQKYKDETYFFEDGTGTIQLDSEIELPIGKTIVVRGDIDQAFLGIGKLELNVKSWRYVK
ncbi:MAG TPA: hypothetical protein VL981_01315 [Candidatus Methylacidiphilales bacterium]|nr:hypothetical protein [Candidatus Methylacidiphilales bacterium]